MKNRLIVLAVLALVAAIAVVSSNAASDSASTLDLTGIVTADHVTLDAKPAGDSAGDISYQTGLLYEHGKRVGRFQDVCTTLPQASQQCSATLGLPRGQVVIEAGYGPAFNTGAVALEAVVGGTGAYARARGQGRDRELSNTKLALHLQLVR